MESPATSTWGLVNGRTEVLKRLQILAGVFPLYSIFFSFILFVQLPFLSLTFFNSLLIHERLCKRANWSDEVFLNTGYRVHPLSRILLSCILCFFRFPSSLHFLQQSFNPREALQTGQLRHRQFYEYWLKISSSILHSQVFLSSASSIFLPFLISFNNLLIHERLANERTEALTVVFIMYLAFNSFLSFTQFLFSP